MNLIAIAMKKQYRKCRIFWEACQALFNEMSPCEDCANVKEKAEEYNKIKEQ